jgi:hypothetical protein
MKASVMISFLTWQERDIRSIAKLCPVEEKKTGKEKRQKESNQTI